jgi:hypothetical protein
MVISSHALTDDGDSLSVAFFHGGQQVGCLLLDLDALHVDLAYAFVHQIVEATTQKAMPPCGGI